MSIHLTGYVVEFQQNKNAIIVHRDLKTKIKKFDTLLFQEISSI